MLRIYGRATSSNVQLVMWAVGELGLAYERLDYGGVHGGLDSAEFQAMNPHGWVPVLRDGDLVIWESGAILRYLAARYGPGDGFWPSDPGARARVDMWAEWGKVQMAAGFTVPIFWSRVRTPAAARDEAALAQAIAQFDGFLAQLEAPLSRHAFVAGEQFSAADIVIGHVLFRYFDIDIPRVERPVIAQYYARLTQRPAFRAHVMVNYDSLRAEGA